VLIEQVDQDEVRVTVRVVRGRRWLPRIRVRRTPGPPSGSWLAVGALATTVAYVVPFLALTELALEAARDPSVPMIVVGSALTWSVLAAGWWALIGVEAAIEPNWIHETHTVRIRAGACRFDGQTSEVWVVGSQLLLGDGTTYALAEDAADVRRLRKLLEPAAEWMRERYGGGERSVPPALERLTSKDR
jgi:hypothetical protein